MTRPKVMLPLTLSLALAIVPAETFEAQGPAVLNQQIDLPQVEGRIDHLAFDPSQQRLFVAALGNDTVEVLDLARSAWIRSITGFHEPQGIALVPGLNTVAVASGRSGDLRFLDTAGLTVIRTVPLSEDADNVRYDVSAKRVYVAHGSGAISAVDPLQGTVTGTVRLGGHPESFQLESGGSRIFANVPDTKAVAVIDRRTMKVVATWPLDGAEANYPMAFDEPRQRLFVGCRKPAKVLVFDTSSGRQVAAFEAVGDADDLFMDPVRGRLYVTGGDGFLEVYQAQDKTNFPRLARVATAAGARTSLYVAEQSRLYVAAPRRRTRGAAILVYSLRD